MCNEAHKFSRFHTRGSQQCIDHATKTVGQEDTHARGSVNSSSEPDEIDVLLAGDADAGGKPVVSRDSYHSLPPSVRGAFKRGDARIVVAENKDHHSSVSAAAESCATPQAANNKLKAQLLRQLLEFRSVSNKPDRLPLRFGC